MPADSPYEAFQEFVEPIQASINCFTPAVFQRKGGHQPRPTPHILLFAENRPARLQGAHRIAMTFVHQYRLEQIEHGDTSGWKVHSVGYWYHLLTYDDQKLVDYHWHPEVPNAAFPHLHVRPSTDLLTNQFSKAHFPTGRSAIEDFLEMAVQAFGVEPLRADWHDVFSRSRTHYERERTWW